MDVELEPEAESMGRKRERPEGLQEDLLRDEEVVRGYLPQDSVWAQEIDVLHEDPPIP